MADSAMLRGSPEKACCRIAGGRCLSKLFCLKSHVKLIVKVSLGL